MEIIIKAKPEKLSWSNKQWYLIHMFCGLLLDRSGIISYLLLLSQQLTYRKGTAVMEISRKQIGLDASLMGQTLQQVLSPEEEKVSQKILFWACPPILGHHPAFPGFSVNSSMHQVSSNFFLRQPLTQKILKILKELSFMLVISTYT